MKVYASIPMIMQLKRLCEEFISQELKDRGIEGIVPSHGRILMELYQADGALSSTVLASKVRCTKSTMTLLIDKLLKFGYVRKLANKVDKRASLIELTAKGKRFEKDFTEISIALNERFGAGFSRKDEELLEQLLARAITNMAAAAYIFENPVQE